MVIPTRPPATVPCRACLRKFEAGKEERILFTTFVETFVRSTIAWADFYP